MSREYILQVIILDNFGTVEWKDVSSSFDVGIFCDLIDEFTEKVKGRFNEKQGVKKTSRKAKIVLKLTIWGNGQPEITSNFDTRWFRDLTNPFIETVLHRFKENLKKEGNDENEN